MKIIEIRELMRSYLFGKYHLIEDIKKLAMEDPSEYKNLIDMFNGEKNVYKKLEMAEILSNFDCPEVKKFLIEVITYDDDKFKKVTDELECFNFAREALSIIDNKIDAAVNLVRMNNEIGVAYIKKIVKTLDKCELDSIARDLYESGYPDDSSYMSLELLLELAEKYEVINDYVSKHKEGITSKMRELKSIN